MGSSTRTLRAFHGDTAVKSKYLGRVREHRAADLLAQGATGRPDRGERGCAVACSMNVYDHSRYPIEIGVPVVLARLEDRIFEGLTPERAMEWPERFLAAIPVGADLSLVWPRFALWLFTERKPLIDHAAKRPDVKAAFDAVGALYREWVETGTRPPYERWEAARVAARRARSAAWAAAEAVEAAAAAEAVEAAAAWAAAAAAEAAAAAAAARAAFYGDAADQLVRLLETAPVPAAA